MALIMIDGRVDRLGLGPTCGGVIQIDAPGSRHAVHAFASESSVAPEKAPGGGSMVENEFVGI
jgi:hypothetical protein